MPHPEPPISPPHAAVEAPAIEEGPVEIRLRRKARPGTWSRPRRRQKSVARMRGTRRQHGTIRRPRSGGAAHISALILRALEASRHAVLSEPGHANRKQGVNWERLRNRQGAAREEPLPADSYLAILAVAAVSAAQTEPKAAGVVNGETISEDQVLKAAAADLQKLGSGTPDGSSGSMSQERLQILHRALDAIAEERMIALEASQAAGHPPADRQRRDRLQRRRPFGRRRRGGL